MTALQPYHTIKPRAPFTCSACAREFWDRAEADRHAEHPERCSTCGHDFLPGMTECPKCDPAF